MIYPTCERTGKVKYPGISSARKATRGIRTKLRPYRCEYCHRIHMTKEPRRD